MEQCPDCEGVGEIYLGKNYVTRDMAIDAGDRSMEGQFYGHRYAPCHTCGGTGEIEVSGEGHPMTRALYVNRAGV